MESSENISDSFKQVCEDLKRLKEEEASMMKKMVSIERKGKESTASSLSQRKEGDTSKDKPHNNSIVIDDLGYSTFEKFKPLNEKNTQETTDSASRTKPKKTTLS